MEDKERERERKRRVGQKLEAELSEKRAHIYQHTLAHKLRRNSMLEPVKKRGGEKEEKKKKRVKRRRLEKCIEALTPKAEVSELSLTALLASLSAHYSVPHSTSLSLFFL